MFGELKKRLANAVKIFARSEEKKAEEQAEERRAEPQMPVEAPKPVEAPREIVVERRPEPRQEPKAEQPKHIERPHETRPEPQHEPVHVEQHTDEHGPAEQPKPEPVKEAPRPEPIMEAPKHVPKPEVHEVRPEKPKKEEPLVKLSFTTKLKGVFLGSVTLNDSEIERFTDNVKISMLESDVSYDTTEAFIEDLTNNLRGKKVDSKRIEAEVTSFVRESLFNILKPAGNGVNVSHLIAERKRAGSTPVKILFLGPNGTGKTTTIAKITNLLKNEGVSVVLSASDTFRAAAIEQLEHHAHKLGVPVIKSSYGADPASIAFDAIAYARSHKADAVLIDSAGRQETNKNLIMEVQKMVKVAQPDIIIYVGESTAGNAISEQIKEFSKFLKINGIVLTKLDCDAKGGGAISISHVTGIPILFFGTGEKYDALVPYSADYIVNAILPNN